MTVFKRTQLAYAVVCGMQLLVVLASGLTFSRLLTHTRQPSFLLFNPKFGIFFSRTALFVSVQSPQRRERQLNGGCGLLPSDMGDH